MEEIIGLAHDYDEEELSFIHMLKKSNVIDYRIFFLSLKEI